MNLLDSFKNLRTIEAELAKVQAEKFTVAKEYGELTHMPRYDQRYSEAKFHNLGQDLERLTSRENELAQKLAELKADPGYLQAKEAKALELTKKRDGLMTQLNEVKAEIQGARQKYPFEIVGGADPVKLAGEMIELEKRVAQIVKALELTLAAIALNVKK